MAKTGRKSLSMWGHVLVLKSGVMLRKCSKTTLQTPKSIKIAVTVATQTLTANSTTATNLTTEEVRILNKAQLESRAS